MNAIPLIYRIPLALVILMVLVGCSKVSGMPRADINGSTPTAIETIAPQEFINADFPCPSKDIVEPNQGYPHPYKQSDPDSGEKSVAEMKGFCARMKQRFADSGMNNIEAASIYAILASDDQDYIPWLHNECYAGPMCDVEPFEMSRQVMVKRISATQYELFYYWIGCGINYHHMVIVVEGGAIQGAEMIERWSESYTC